MTVRSKRQCLRVLIESLLSITGGVWTTAETGIEENEDEGGQNPVGVLRVFKIILSSFFPFGLGRPKSLVEPSAVFMKSSLIAV